MTIDSADDSKISNRTITTNRISNRTYDSKSNRITKLRRSLDATVRGGLRSAASSTVAVPRTMSSLGDRSFAAAGPRAWNRLPPPLRRVHSTAVFKRQLKTFLFDRAFN